MEDNSFNIYFLIQLIAIIFLFISIIILQNPNSVSTFIEEELVGHMIVEHGIFFLFGYFSMSLIDTIRKRKPIQGYYLIPKNKSQYANTEEDKQNIPKEQKKHKFTRINWIIAIIVLMVFWHLPAIFDFALYHDPIHIIQHMSFIAVGICIYQITKKFDFTIVMLFLILNGAVMGIAGLFFVLSNNPVYSYYTIQSHIDSGNAMIIAAMITTFVIVPALLIKKSINLIKNSAENNNNNNST